MTTQDEIPVDAFAYNTNTANSKASSSPQLLRGEEGAARILEEHEFKALRTMDGLTSDEMLLRSARVICQKHSVGYAQLSAIQRKFITHYRCPQCGLLPLYFINLSHPKRVRCRGCGQLVAFTNKGKYGRYRKEIAFLLAKVIGDDYARYPIRWVRGDPQTEKIGQGTSGYASQMNARTTGKSTISTSAALAGNSNNWGGEYQ